MQWILTIVYALVCTMLIGVVLLQRGKESGGGIFGTGSSAVLSSQGTTSFLVRLTSILGALFFILSLSLGFVINRQADQVRLSDVMQAADIVKADEKSA